MRRIRNGFILVVGVLLLTPGCSFSGNDSRAEVTAGSQRNPEVMYASNEPRGSSAVTPGNVVREEIYWDPTSVPDGFRRTSHLKKCTYASARLPLSRGSSIKSPSQLADRIEQSLAQDSNGNAVVKGTNMTPNMYLHSINAAKARVSGVSGLPVYLRSLDAHPMPQGRKFRMSLVFYEKKTNCVEQYTVDTAEGFAREAHPNEMAWVDTNDSTIVFAQNCTNSPLDVERIGGAQVVIPPKAEAAPQPAPEPVSYRGCPADRQVEPNIYSWARMSEEYRERTRKVTAQEQQRRITNLEEDSVSFSSTIGVKLGQQARAGAEHLWSNIPVPVKILWQSGRNMGDRELVGTYQITGKQLITLKNASAHVRQGDTLVFVFPERTISPPRGVSNGANEVWLLPSGWTECGMRVHAVYEQ